MGAGNNSGFDEVFANLQVKPSKLAGQRLWQAEERQALKSPSRWNCGCFLLGRMYLVVLVTLKFVVSRRANQSVELCCPGVCMMVEVMLECNELRG